jgi:hypothetical protein
MDGRAELYYEFFPSTRVIRIRIISGDEVVGEKQNMLDSTHA